MFALVTDRPDPWLKYIWEEFCAVQKPASPGPVIDYRELDRRRIPESFTGVVEYGDRRKIPGSLFIPRRANFRTDACTWIDQGFPVFTETLAVTHEAPEYDLFYNAFIHLSRLEEWQADASGSRIRSYAFRHPRRDKSIWKIPVVNLLFNRLEKLIRSRFPKVAFKPPDAPVIEFTHDVDYLRKTGALRIKQSLFHAFNAGRHLLGGRFSRAADTIEQAFRFIAGSSEYRYFDRWAALEKELGIASTFFLYAAAPVTGNWSLRKQLLDPSYDIRRDEALRDACRMLADAGHRIGIHGSYFSAREPALFAQEKEILETALNMPIALCRQHWLNYTEAVTPYIHASTGIREDFTLGFNDIAGFRAGIASRYRPYDHITQKPFEFHEIPLVLMDAHLYDYASDTGPPDCQWLLDNMRHIKSFHVSVDWHQRMFSDDYGWIAAYPPLVKAYKERLKIT